MDYIGYDLLSKPQKNLHSKKKELYVLNKLLNEKIKIKKIISNYKFPEYFLY